MCTKGSLTLVVSIFGVIYLGKYAQCHGTKEKSFSTSVSDMEQLLFTEQLLIDTVEKYTDELQAKVNALKNLINELRTQNQKAITNPEEYLSNPLNGFSLIRRMHYDWPNIEIFMQKPVGESYLKVLQAYRPEMPTTRDLHEASEAIYRLQETYDLKASDMAEGILNGKQHNVKLKAIDRYFMGYHLYKTQGYYYAAFWIYSAIGSFIASDYTRIVDFGVERIWSLYAETLLQQNRPADALVSIKTASELKPEDAALMKRRNDIEYVAKINKDPPIKYEKPPPDTYELGCRGGFSHQTSRFHCVYNTTTSAFVRLAPLKMEIIQLDPYLVLYHDVISDSEIKDLQELAKPNLERATVYSDDINKSEVVERRTSKFSWFQDNTSNTTLRLNQRIKDMTGFDIVGSEMLQVMNYGLGGHYDTHYDFFNVSDTADVVRQEGDRISTVLFYVSAPSVLDVRLKVIEITDLQQNSFSYQLSDVEQGGATVFPNIQTAVFPRKGSAVVWYNLNNQVVGDWRTLHAACPVIVGSKWVCNKWIRAKAQMFRRPCFK